MKMGRCSVKNCPSSFDNDGIKPTGVEFYQFPSPEESLRVLHWKLACNDKEIMEKDPSELNKLNLICSKHFDKYFRIGLKLKMDAVPTLKLFLPPDNALESQIEPLDDVSTETKMFSNAQTQTTMDLTLGIPKVNKLKKLVLVINKICSCPPNSDIFLSGKEEVNSTYE